jgi:hypothetical protein
VNILIIGNGFDIEHGLQTRYTDFLDWTAKFKQNSNDVLNDTMQSGMKAEFTEFVQGNFWLEHFQQRREQEKLKGEKWIDFENEISRVVAYWEAKYYTDCKSIDDGLQRNPTPFEELQKFTRAFEIYCVCVVNQRNKDFAEQNDIKGLSKTVRELTEKRSELSPILTQKRERLSTLENQEALFSKDEMPYAHQQSALGIAARNEMEKIHEDAYVKHATTFF